ncbi:hypothetical protein ACFYRN_19050 [Streptomyces sp. NPDC005227]|uniref:hypothetical protein n=1 Tax=Streptomyces sp. NPDC005227 TaxID=3364707 RepID=UPI0036837A00
MSDEATGEQESDEVQPSRIAGVFVLLVLAAVAVLVLRAVVAAAPYTAYFVAGIIVTAGWYRAKAWRAKRRGEEVEVEDEPDVAEALRYLSRNGDHVLLTQLQKHVGAKDTKAVRRLLKVEKIKVRQGVRTPKGNGPGVHQDDIPAPPPPEDTPSEGGCSCRSATTPTPTTAGPTVEPIGLAGMVVKDGSEASRRHRIG